VTSAIKIHPEEVESILTGFCGLRFVCFVVVMVLCVSEQLHEHLLEGPS
jgi:hypothetical protein